MDMSFLYGATGGGVVGILLYWLVSRQMEKDSEERRDMKSKIDYLENEKFAKLEKNQAGLQKTIEDHIDNDKSQAILNELKNIAGSSEKMYAEIKVMSRDVTQLLVNDGKQDERIESVNRYVAGVDKSFREHKMDHPGGKGNG